MFGIKARVIASSIKWLFNFATIALLLTGCAQRGLFYWDDYESSLYERYVEHNPAQAEVYLRESIVGAERRNYRVPPGVYADYGFLLFRRGDKQGAIDYFTKEKQLYPEAAALMNKLIERVQMQMAPIEKQPVKTPDSGDAQ